MGRFPAMSSRFTQYAQSRPSMNSGMGLSAELVAVTHLQWLL